MKVMPTLFYRIIRYWIPPISWMSLIFYLSSNHRVAITGTFTFDFVIFKSLHMIEYAILYFLLFRAFYSISNPSTSLRTNKQLTINKKLFIPVLLSVLYAITDEFHQTFVPSREGRVRDVLIDTSGILLMYIYIKNNLRVIKKFL